VQEPVREQAVGPVVERAAGQAQVTVPAQEQVVAPVAERVPAQAQLNIFTHGGHNKLRGGVREDHTHLLPCFVRVGERIHPIDLYRSFCGVHQPIEETQKC